MTGWRWLALAVAIIAPGCASVPREAGFSNVRDDVARRTGQTVQWNRLSADDRTVQVAIGRLLEKDLIADRAVQIALLNNRELQATYEDLGVGQADVVQAGLLRNPVFDAELKFAEGGGGTNIELAVVQDFLDVLFISMRKRIASGAFAAAKLRVTGAVIDLVGEVRTAFYEHAAAGQMLELRKTVLEATEASYELAQRIHAAGNSTDLALANERALHEQAKLDLAAAETQVLETREELNVLMGVWGPQTTWQVSERLADPPARELETGTIERDAVEQNLDLLIARHQIGSAAQTLGLRRTLGLIPEAEIGVAAEREAEGEWAVGPAFSLPIPLFDQGQPAVARARAELERARQQYIATAVRVRSTARAARNRLLAARARAEYLRQVMLPLRREITEQTQLQYNAMNAGAFQLLAAKQAEIETGAQYVEALREYWIARARLQQV